MVLMPVYKDNFVDSEKNKPCIFFQSNAVSSKLSQLDCFQLF